jgi:hypothetical protein
MSEHEKDNPIPLIQDRLHNIERRELFNTTKEEAALLLSTKASLDQFNYLQK